MEDKTEFFKTLVFTDERADVLGKYVTFVRNDACGGIIPLLMMDGITIEDVKKVYPSADFTGIELVTIALRQV